MTYTEATEKTKSIIDKEFLEKLAEVGRLYGWSGDYIEIEMFIRELYVLAELDHPKLDPYKLTE